MSLGVAVLVQQHGQLRGSAFHGLGFGLFCAASCITASARTAFAGGWGTASVGRGSGCAARRCITGSDLAQCILRGMEALRRLGLPQLQAGEKLRVGGGLVFEAPQGGGGLRLLHAQRRGADGVGLRVLPRQHGGLPMRAKGRLRGAARVGIGQTRQ